MVNEDNIKHLLVGVFLLVIMLFIGAYDSIKSLTSNYQTVCYLIILGFLYLAYNRKTKRLNRQLVFFAGLFAFINLDFLKKISISVGQIILKTNPLIGFIILSSISYLIIEDLKKFKKLRLSTLFLGSIILLIKFGDRIRFLTKFDELVLRFLPNVNYPRIVWLSVLFVLQLIFNKVVFGKKKDE